MCADVSTQNRADLLGHALIIPRLGHQLPSVDLSA